ncbi:hypothetical protein, partial [Bacillus subtilis]|uniref:hypothetical protein n=1 Tax=Bacillus subtilis TaxID=1423 RepID=UPI001BDB9902
MAVEYGLNDRMVVMLKRRKGGLGVREMLNWVNWIFVEINVVGMEWLKRVVGKKMGIWGRGSWGVNKGN